MYLPIFHTLKVASNGPRYGAFAENVAEEHAVTFGWGGGMIRYSNESARTESEEPGDERFSALARRSGNGKGSDN